MSAAAFVGPLLWAAGDLRPRERRRDSFFSDRAGGAMGLFKLPQLKQDLSTPFIKRTLSNANLESLRACMTDAHGPSLPAFVKHDGMTAADEVIEQQSYPMLVWILGIAALCLLLMLFVAHAALHKRWQIERRVAELCKEDSSTYFAYDRRLKEACLQWRRASRRARRKLNNLSWAVDHMLKRQLSQGLASWIEMAETRAEVMRKLRFGISFVTSRKLALGFASWRSSCARMALEAKEATLMAPSIQHFLQAMLGYGLHTWISRHQDVVQAWQLIRYAVGRFVERQMARCLSSWLELAEQRADIMRKLRLCLTRVVNRQLVVGFQDWKHGVAWKTRQAIRRLMNQGLARGWSSWRTLYQRCKHVMASAHYIAARLLRRSLSKGFSSWASLVAPEVYKCLMFFAHRQLARAWVTWCTLHAKQSENLSTVEFAVRRIGKGRLSKAFVTWIEMAEARAEVMRKFRFGISFVISRKLALGFASWSESSHAASTQNTKQAMSRAVRQMMNRKLSRCWLAWLGAQQDERWRLESMRRSSSYLANGELAKLSRAYDTWLSLTRQHGNVEERYQTCVSWTSRQALCWGFAKWHQCASELKRLEEKMDLMNCAERKVKRSQLANGWERWQDAQLFRYWTQFRAEKHSSQQRLVIAWGAWRDAHREMTHRIESLQWAVDHMLKRQLSQGLASWIEMAETRAEVMRKLRFGGA